MNKVLAVGGVILLLFLFTTKTYSQSYNYYFGNLHAHTGYSDGSKDSTTSGVSTPGKAYWFAKQTYHFDFLGISEHNHHSAGMVKSDYALGKAQSDTANANGTFAALYGMEYGVINNGGHVLIYGIDSLIGWDSISNAPNYSIYNAEYDYANLWSKINARSKAFASLAHPNSGDYSNLDLNSYDATADAAIYGVAVRSGSAFSTTINYTDAAATSYESMFKKYLALGYHVAPTLDADNHYTTFGRTNQGRTVVLARSLNRDSILAAYKLMHFYASDDWNTQVNFTVAGKMMGTDFQSLSNPTIVVTATDPDVGESISNISIYRGVVGSGTNATSVKSSNSVSSVTYNPTSFTLNTKYYYYAKITEADGDIIWTAPIWFQKVTVLLPIESIELNLSQTAQQIVIDFDIVGTDENVKNYSLEKSYDLTDWQPIHAFEKHTTPTYTYTDEINQQPLVYYRVKANLTDDECLYSPIKGLNLKQHYNGLTNIFPNPVQHSFSMLLHDACGVITALIYTTDGQLIQTIYSNANGDKNETITFAISSLPAAKYLVDIKLNNERIYSSSFVKE
jgi:hypothetical protein